MRWGKRFKDANRCLDILKDEIAGQSLNSVLDEYLQKKNTELENSKLVMKSAHVNKINTVYQMEMDNWNKISLKASEIVQDNFLLLRSMGELDNEMLEKLQSLVKLLQGQRSVKFADDEPDVTATHSNPDATGCLSYHISDLSDYASDEVIQSPLSVKKRCNEESELENESKKTKSASTSDFQFLRPKALKSINFGSLTTMPTPMTTESSDDNNLNITFDLILPGSSIALAERTNQTDLPASSSSASAAAKGKRKKFLIVLLMPNKFSILTAFKHSKPNGAKFTLNINKENKKFSPGSSRVKKLTRTPSRVAGSKGESKHYLGLKNFK